ncbi:thioesterase II family protein [Streptomyces sp. ISL-94]|uniref:thioesterase II family protein n=1 Tax=Streptomyces sp. ISL-94 TaxID=2819190 RepID=UPI001BE82905|nr:alpha/beta fold hydrolase [Streptomyces sp. ISL-94]MBT2479331.1 thioesterase [Streptomyces sp. ISL-94]
MTEASEASWIRRFHPADGSSVRLVCLPHAGGSASFYFPMSQALAPAVDVMAIQYPGRQDRRHEPCIEDIGQLANAIAAVLEPWLDRPTALFGHSMGATLAFEVTRILEAKYDFTPEHLFVSGRRAPSLHRDERVHLAGDDGIVREMLALQGTDAAVLADDELLRMALPALRGDYKAIETYRAEPGATVRAAMTALTGDADPRVAVADADAWSAHTSGGFGRKVFPGGHFYLAAQQKEIVSVISDRLFSA